MHRANDRLAEVIEEDPTVDGMGTTLTAVMVDGERVRRWRTWATPVGTCCGTRR